MARVPRMDERDIDCHGMFSVGNSILEAYVIKGSPVDTTE